MYISEKPLSEKQGPLPSLPWKEEAENTEKDGHLEINSVTENIAPGQLLWASHYYEHSHLQAKGQLPGVTDGEKGQWWIWFSVGNPW